MKEEKMLEILNRIKNCITIGSLDTAKELVELEIDNLEEITQKRCKNTKYYFYNWYCKYCYNTNCKEKSK